MYYLDKFCYICMNKSGLKHLFEVDTDGISHYSKLTSSVAEMNFKEMNNQRLICAECCVTLNTVYNFRQMCLRSKTSLLTYISQLQTPDHISGTIRICLKDIKPKLIVKNRGGNEIGSYSFEESNPQIKFQTKSYKVNIDLPASRNEECESKDGDSSEHEDVTVDYVNEDAQSDVKSEDVEHQTMVEFNNIEIKEDPLAELKEEPKSDTKTPQDGSTSQADTDTSEEPKGSEATTIGKESHQCEIFQKSFNRKDILTNHPRKPYEISKTNILDTIRLSWHRLKQNGSTSLEDTGAEAKGTTTIGTELIQYIAHDNVTVDHVNESDDSDVKVEDVEHQRSETITIGTELIQNTAPVDVIVDHVNESAHSDFKVEDVEHETMMEDSSECYMELNKMDIEEHPLMKEEAMLDTETPQDVSTSQATSEKPKKCEICKESFIYMSQSTRHSLIHSDETIYKCEICKKGFNNDTNLSQHMQIHSRGKPYECEICKKIFCQKSSLNRHMLEHSDERPNECEICKKIFSQKGNLNRHMLVHSGERPYKCKICEKSFGQKGTLEEHMQIHSRQKFKCKTCNKSFNQARSLANHMGIHVVGPYGCEICTRRFIHMDDFTKHMKKHTRNSSQKCEICKKLFSRKSNLIKHMLVHSGEKPYKCKICEKAFRQSGTLKDHMQRHLKCICKICKKTFKQKRDLDAHMENHSD